MSKNKIHKRVFAAYPSSLVQQNFGESVKGHGYLKWDLENDTVEEVDIHNDTSYVNVYIQKDTDYENLSIPLGVEKTDDIRVKVNWNDYSTNMTTLNTLLIKKHLKDVHGIFGNITFSRNPIDQKITLDNNDGRINNIKDVNVQRDILLTHLTSLGLEQETIDGVLQIDEAITQRVEHASEEFPTMEWRLISTYLDNFKSHGERTEINWADKNGIWQVSGENENGKSCIFDSIMYLLYGKTPGTSSGRPKHGDTRFINNKRTLDYCEVGGVITINDEYYRVVRRTERTWNRKKDAVSGCSTSFTVTRLDSDMNIVEDESVDKKQATERMFHEVIGDFDDFMRTAFVNADTLNHLLSTEHSKFVDSVLRDSGLDIYEKKLSHFKDWKKSKYDKENRVVTDIIKNNAEVEDIKLSIKEMDDKIDNLRLTLKDKEASLTKGETYLGGLYKKIHPISDEIRYLDTTLVSKEVQTLLDDKDTKRETLRQLEATIANMKTTFDSDGLAERLSKKEKFTEWVYKKRNVIKNLEHSIFTVDSKIGFINGEIVTLTKELAMTQREIENNKTHITRQIENIRQEIAILESSKTCPTCLRETDQDTIKGITATIASKLSYIDTLNEEYRKEDERYEAACMENQADKVAKENEKIPVREEIAKIESEITSIKELIDTQTLKMEEMALEITKISQDKEEVERRNTLEVEARNYPTQIELIDAKIEIKRGQLVEHQTTLARILENEKVEDLIKLSKDKIAVIRDDINQIKDDINQIELVAKVKALKDIDTLNALSDALIAQDKQDRILSLYEKAIHRDGIPSAILRKSLVTINMELANLLEDVNITVFINNDLVMKMYDYDNPDTAINVIEGSGMQRTFASIVLRLALRKINNKSRLDGLFLDEVMGRLDSNNVVKFSQLLMAITKEIPLIVIVEHGYSDVLSPDASIVVEKDESGVSSINVWIP
jgi:DNA repair exonuclease SbcCD ATPase subunit